MPIEFYKYQGTGNDFVLIDNRQSDFPKNDTKMVQQLCDRKFGIGADGLILLEESKDYDFSMVYYNSDGNLSSMCGNGGRCLVHFASFLGIIDNLATFEAIDGIHKAQIADNMITLGMSDVQEVQEYDGYVFLDTGSPHHVQMVDDVDSYNIHIEGRKIRRSIYGEAGSNVNFVTQMGPTRFKVRTYERGVEGETLSCGTGVTAVAIAMNAMERSHSERIELETPGGNLEVCFKKDNGRYTEVMLKGPVAQVYKGILS